MPAPPRNVAPLVTALCWVVVVFDGYDLIVYGTVLPQLLTEPGWNLTSSTAGLLGSLAFLGMLLGALLAGRLADALGRRRTILACTAWFSVFTALCAIAPDPVVFGAFRLLAGLGLGGLVPSANALGSEFVPARSRSLVATLMMSGVPIGGSLAALIGIAVLPRYGWPAMFAIALLALVLVLPLCAWLLPESPAWLRAKGRIAQAEALERKYSLVPETETVPHRGFRALLKPPCTRATVLFALATLATLFAWYGLGTWLPQLMRQSGFDLGSALTFLLALNLGAVGGSLVTAWAGARLGPRRAAVLAAAVAAAGLLVLVLRPSQAGAYLALVLAGVGTHGTQCLIIAAVADHYPAPLRGSALGSALGIGRIGAVLAPQAGGWLLAAGFGVTANFLVFAIGAAVASGFVWACPRPVIRKEGVVTR
ncbi:aromatic acid/H+ symport family MFS transporter [Amycolatopsis thermalba]|uniref:Aromatic acid/H+ symport family MFS transporter n=1 Tax=Amycolatopsis thermalba TaxID=944492 RepID=A0ABY4P019_9PSEU|nr:MULTISPECIES: aromatic acid/H+ symport family MFS transporter [Amycolatopsis]OXM65132.1 MFS transporter [Amycolatopsis sp. KNN50.9b]UQS25670.1 aromatic acid/H+ symport family MFS transporter [Amycolatopsis thermalba]